MKLTVPERLVINELLPQKGNMVTMILAESILSKTSIKSDDIQKYSIKNAEGGVITWDKKNDDGEEFLLNEAEINLLKDQVDKYDKEGNITNRILSICKKIKDL